MGAMASKKARGVFARQAANGVGECRRCQRAGRDDDVAPFGWRQPGDFLAANLDPWVRGKRRADRCGKAVAIHRQRAASRHLIGVGAAHDEGVQLAEFSMQQADSVVGSVVGTE